MYTTLLGASQTLNCVPFKAPRVVGNLGTHKASKEKERGGKEANK
jgi:hypothetical protein